MKSMGHGAWGMGVFSLFQSLSAEEILPSTDLEEMIF